MGSTLNSFFLFFIIIFVFSCNDTKQPAYNEGSSVKKEDLVRANQFLAGKDLERIKAYAERRNWDIEFTGTGLGYDIYKSGEGSKVEKGSSVTIEYIVSLIDGTVCYSSETDGAKTFRVGQGGVEAGLEEGILMLREGDRARFIIPPYLAHGLIGDQNRIPPRAILVYEVSVIGVYFGNS